MHYTHKYLDKHCGLLSEETINEIAGHGDPDLTKVIKSKEEHSYGIIVLANDDDNEYKLFYVRRDEELGGLICDFKINDKNRNEFTLAFVAQIKVQYPNLKDSPQEVFNTFQLLTIGLMESLSIPTYGDDEKGATMLFKAGTPQPQCVPMAKD